MSTQGKPEYRLEQHIGFLLRKASQRSNEIFATLMPSVLTPTRFAAIAKLYEMEALSQNELGRQTAMDVATIKGVVDRLCNLGLVSTAKDPDDGRKHLVRLTVCGKEIFEKAAMSAFLVTDKTFEQLTKPEMLALIKLLKKIS